MNYTETFNDFATRVSTLDLALYAGIGLVLWTLFKDKLSPVQKFLLDFTNNIKSKSDSEKSTTITTPIVNKEDIFFELVSSWKNTRDLAVRSNCEQAVKVADQMFPFLSPNSCQTKSE